MPTSDEHSQRVGRSSSSLVREETVLDALAMGTILAAVLVFYYLVGFEITVVLLLALISIHTGEMSVKVR